MGSSEKRVNLDWAKKPTKASFFTKPHVYHALVIIFLEFFAFGLVTNEMIDIVDKTFASHTFLMNGLIMGVKGFLSFFSAPLVGALSDVFGRKVFLLLTVSVSCSPIPLMAISEWWYFLVVIISGVFAVTFSVVFAYVADITTEEDRSWTYGLVSATFAASLVTSPVIGAYLGKLYGHTFVIAVATVVTAGNILFILFCVPESLPQKCRPTHWGSKISWEKADPFSALRRVSKDRLILILCITTFLSYLPEAGEYSCFFVYLRLVMFFTEVEVAKFIAVVGIVSCISQTFFLSNLISTVGPKRCIIFGLLFEMAQLTIYGFSNDNLMLWLAGILAGIGSLTYPAISSFVSNHASKDEQGVTQGVLTGIRGLCGGLGPALYGFVFYVFQVDLSSHSVGPVSHQLAVGQNNLKHNKTLDVTNRMRHFHETIMPGPPFAVGALLVFFATMVSLLIPSDPHSSITVNKNSNHEDEEGDDDEGYTKEDGQVHSNKQRSRRKSSSHHYSLIPSFLESQRNYNDNQYKRRQIGSGERGGEGGGTTSDINNFDDIHERLLHSQYEKKGFTGNIGSGDDSKVKKRIKPAFGHHYSRIMTTSSIFRRFWLRWRSDRHGKSRLSEQHTKVNQSQNVNNKFLSTQNNDRFSEQMDEGNFCNDSQIKNVEPPVEFDMSDSNTTFQISES